MSLTYVSAMALQVAVPSSRQIRAGSNVPAKARWHFHLIDPTLDIDRYFCLKYNQQF
jgi:hypothetical protein